MGWAVIPDPEWLIVIDMQRAFGTAGSVWNAPGFHAIAPRIERLMAAYGERVILTRYVPPDPIEGAWRAYFAAFPSMRLPADDPAWDITLAHPAAARIETRVTFGKWDAGIAAIVGPDAPIALCGATTECCVLATALAAADAGHAVRVFEDACTGATPELHQKAIALMAAFAPVIQITSDPTSSPRSAQARRR